jgi:hypothetical protein
MNNYKKNRTFTSSILKAAQKDAEKFNPQHTQELNTQLMEKWHKFGLLKGLPNDRMRSNVSQLLENAAQYMINEADTTDAEGYNTVIFPMVRRVWAGLLANEIVSVQPMSLPSGLVFYMDFVDEEGNRVQDQNFYNLNYGIGTKYWLGYGPSNFTDVVHGSIMGAGIADPSSWVNLHIDAQYHYYTGTPSNAILATSQDSQHTVDADAYTKDPVTDLHKYSMPTVYAYPSNRAHDFGKWVRFYVVTGTPEASNQVQLNLGGLPGNLSLIFKDPSCLTNGGLYTIDGTESIAVPLAIGGSAATDGMAWAGAELLVDFGYNPFEVGDNFNQPTNNYLLQGEETSNIRSINLEIKSSAIVAETRKLKTKWTPELAQDLQAYHSIDAESELTGAMSDEVALEIDREIIRDILGSAGAEIEIDISGSIGGGETVQDKYRTAIEAILAGSNLILKRTMRGYGNWIIVSPEFATVLEFGGAFLRNDTDKTITYSGGMHLAGLLENRVKVYVDPLFPASQAIMGYTGSSFMETGYVYAPYVPIQLTPTVYDPHTFVPRKGLMTRYGKKLIRSDYFCRFNITGWPSAGLGAAIYSGGFGEAQRTFDVGRTAAWNPLKLN